MTISAGACGTDTAAYALGALEPHEAERFVAHLAGCSVCRDELAAFAQVVDTLPLTVPRVQPPRRLRRALLAAAAAEATGLRSRRADTLDSRAHRVPVAPRRPWRPRLRVALPAPALAALGAGLLALVGVAGVELAPTGHSARTYPVTVAAAGASASLRVSGGRAELVVHHLRAPRAGRIYEVWVERGNGGPVPTSALFSVTSRGDGDVVVPGRVAGLRHVMVTEEPIGGSRVPTSAPVLVATV